MEQRKLFLQQKMKESNSADLIIDNIIAYSQQQDNLLDKYNLQFFLNYFDRNAILSLSDSIPPHQQLNSQDFLRLFLLRIPHSQQQTLFLALSLKQLFDCILERTNSSQTIKFSDFTTYLCQKISREDLDVVLSPKRIPKQRLEPDSQRIRSIDLQPVEILRKVRIEPPKISKDMPRWNRKLDEKRGVAKFYHSSDQRKIVAMGTLSSSIFIYDQELKDKIQIRPNECKQMEKDIGILSMAYNGESNRIGAVLTNSSLIFWEGGDNFSTEKIISNKCYGDRIYHLQLANQWVTTSKNSLNFWDLKEETVTRTIHIQQSSIINDICQITHLRAICVAIVTLKDEKHLLIYHQQKRVARICLDSAGCHTLHYNRLTQGLVPLGYQNILQVYTIQGTLFDVQLKYVLRGHRSIITCVDSQQNGSLMITGDDVGEIRIWQLTRMRCIQAIKLTKWLGQLRLAGQKLFYSDSRINALQLDHFEMKQTQDLGGIYHFYDDTQQSLWVLTHKDARRIDANQGKVRRIYLLCDEDDDISAAVKVGDGFIVGTSKGQLFHYDSDCNLRWQKQAHQAQIRQILFDSQHRLIFSLGAQGKISAWPERNAETQEERKSISFKGRQINLLCISSRSTMLIAGHNEQCELSLWDYQVLKLYELLQMRSAVTAVLISQTVDLIVIATIDTISFVKFTKKQHMLDLELIHQLNLAPILSEISQTKQIGNVTCLQLIILDNHRHLLTVGTINGQLLSINVTKLIQTHFNSYCSCASRESVNILRNQREDFQTSFSQHGFKRNIDSLKSKEYDASLTPIIWNLQLSKQSIACIQTVPIQEELIGVVCYDYLKLISCKQGQVVAALNINHPLPSKWDLKMERKTLLKKSIYEVLKILDSILKNSGYQMLARQYRMINITEFMQMIRQASFNLPKNDSQVQLLSSEYQPEDILGHKRHEPSLKTLEAYKRVKHIKKMSQEAISLPVVAAERNRQANLDKEYISQLLSPSHFAISQKHEEERVNQGNFTLTARLNQNLNLSKNLLTRQSIKPNILKDMINCSSLSNLSKSCVLKEQLKLRQKEWHKRNEDKDIRQILSDLNNKLRNYRKNYSRPSL